MPVRETKSATTPERSTAAAFPKYLTGELVADSIALQWSGLYARRWRLPRVVDRLLVPATPEPHISCNLQGMAEFQERDVGGTSPARFSEHLTPVKGEEVRIDNVRIRGQHAVRKFLVDLQLAFLQQFHR